METRDRARVEKGGLLYYFDTTIEHLYNWDFLGGGILLPQKANNYNSCLLWMHTYLGGKYWS